MDSNKWRKKGLMRTRALFAYLADYEPKTEAQRKTILDFVEQIPTVMDLTPTDTKVFFDAFMQFKTKEIPK